MRCSIRPALLSLVLTAAVPAQTVVNSFFHQAYLYGSSVDGLGYDPVKDTLFVMDRACPVGCRQASSW